MLFTGSISNLFIIAIKAIQELVKIDKNKDAKIDTLQKQIDELRAIILKGNQSSASSQAINTSLTNALLEQNAPNPFANATTIRYTLPQQRSSNGQNLQPHKSSSQIKLVRQ
jgi:hypothetical protein